MNLKTIISIIPIISVMVMIIWGITAQDWSICWISVCIGGVLMLILKLIDIGLKKKN